MPLSITPPTVDELLMWHTQFQIRAVEFNITHYPDWVVAIAALNMRLKKLRQPLWSIMPAREAAVDKGLRLGNGKYCTLRLKFDHLDTREPLPERLLVF